MTQSWSWVLGKWGSTFYRAKAGASCSRIPCAFVRSGANHFWGEEVKSARWASELLLDHTIFQGMVAQNPHTSAWCEQLGSVMEKILESTQFIIDGNAESLEDLREEARCLPCVHAFHKYF